MNGFLSKVTLFDLLSMIVPGYLVLFLMSHCFLDCPVWHYDELTFYVAAFTISYIVGMLIHYFARFIFSYLRNNECMIKSAMRRFNHSQKNMKQKEHEADLSHENLMEEYYAAYYRVSMGYCSSSLSVLEAQYSFLRSMVIVGMLYLVFGCLGFGVCILSGIAILVILSFLMMIVILRKIHYVVWEDNYYISTNIQKDKNS